MPTIGKYLFAEDISREFPKKKTKTYQIVSYSSGVQLGIVKWYASWRQYCFFPERETIFNKVCLKDITNFIEKL